MTPVQLSDAVVRALQDLVRDGAVALAPPRSVAVLPPRHGGHGDWSTNAALELAGAAGLAPRELASLVADRLKAAPGVAEVEVSGAGHLNVCVDEPGTVAVQVLAAGAAYGAAEPFVLVAPPDLPDVQYVAARAASLLRNATDFGLGPESADPGLLVDDAERHLLVLLGDHPRVVADAVARREPERLARHLRAVATSFLDVQETAPALPRGDEENHEGHRARLLLVAATRQVLVNGLTTLGLTAPERM